MSDIICAISTPPGMGAIAVVRLSGSGCIELIDNVFVAQSGKKLADTESNRVVFGRIFMPDNRSSLDILDEVLIAAFRAPHSFTGEDIVEIYCHGSIYIQQQMLELLIARGARLAKPGEFTRRAFSNGKCDLSQAEAVGDLIASTSRASHRIAMNQMRGGWARRLNALRNKMLQFDSLIELELDFSEEDVEFADRGQLLELVNEITLELESLVNSFSLGNAIKHGVPVAIIGDTNVGKSTLLNLLLNEDKAIVSNIRGTTRDVIEDTVNIRGVMFRFIDTAGIRETTDEIEAMGVERTFKAIEGASIILWVIDLRAPEKDIRKLFDVVAPWLNNEKKMILLFNKSDLWGDDHSFSIDKILPEVKCDRLAISAKQHYNIDKLQDLLVKAAAIPEIEECDLVVTNVRHYEALSKALAAIRRVENGLHNNLTSDLLTQDIRESMFYIGEITGQITTDEVLNNIFSRFCIGK